MTGNLSKSRSPARVIRSWRHVGHAHRTLRRSAHVELVQGTRRAIVGRGERFGKWTLMAIGAGPQPYAIVEDFVHKDGEFALRRRGRRAPGPRQIARIERIGAVEHHLRIMPADAC